MPLMTIVSSMSGNRIGEEIFVDDDERQSEKSDFREHVNAVIGWRIAEARMGARISQERLARALGVHRNTLLRWEQGECSMDAGALYIACCVLNVSPVSILRTITLPAKREDTEAMKAYATGARRYTGLRVNQHLREKGRELGGAELSRTKSTPQRGSEVKE